ncbi:hypothetical protein VTJ04DRAFT_7250 [Mycothermus thermophilus]|uniref:uncharacterized protein n=1 Tax=Humicola insolens TaxID=85995 RepID=UPI003743966B
MPRRGWDVDDVDVDVEVLPAGDEGPPGQLRRLAAVAVEIGDLANIPRRDSPSLGYFQVALVVSLCTPDSSVARP